MRLKRLLVSNFRNYENVEIFWHPQINIIRGFNAQGKSNLLEAIAYLSLASSFRGASDSELIKFSPIANPTLLDQNPEMAFCQEDFFHIQGDVVKEHNPMNPMRISVGFTRDKRKSWKINEKPHRRLTEILGRFHTVIFSPEDLLLVKSGPVARRRYLNRQMIQLYPDYYTLMLRYNQILKQRNSLLRQPYSSHLREQLEPWNSQLAEYAALIYKRRLEILADLSVAAGIFHNQLCQQEGLRLEYRSFLPQQELTALSEEEIATAFCERLVENYVVEKARGLTLIGPHRDDLEIFINEVSARRFGSQGQQRSAALSLKLAELELANKIKGEYPVLLLDDVMSELDENRRTQLLTLMGEKAQLFITATDLNFTMLDGKIILVNQGRILEQN